MGKKGMMLLKTLLIKNGFLVDGSGNPGKRGSLLIRGDRIERVVLEGEILKDVGVDEVFDAEGFAVSPGFIDIHSHQDALIFANPMSEAKLRQGVTTEVIGNCGFSPFPAPKDEAKLKIFVGLMESLDFQFPAEGVSWTDFDSFMEMAEKRSFGTNLLPLVAHGAIRVTAMGGDQRAPSEEEMNKMALLLKESLEQGAWGMSSGLAYAPGSFAEPEEIEMLCGEIKKADSFYTSHVRNEGDGVLPSIDEAIEMGRKTGCRVNISHIKAMGVANWNQSDIILKKLADAKGEGIDVSADQYPYPASSTILGVLTPKWANDGGTEKLCERILNREENPTLLAEIEKNMMSRGGPDRVIITRCATTYDPPVGGRTITEIAEEFGLSPIDTVAKLIVESVNSVSAIYLSLADEDVSEILKDSEIMVGSDGMVNLEYPQYSHPRTFGTFPRVLGRYVREEKILSLESAIRKMTSLPAERIGLKGRGLLKPGYVADITIFDPATVGDRGTYTEANLEPVGIYRVMMNGEWIVQSGKLTGKKCGKILRKE